MNNGLYVEDVSLNFGKQEVLSRVSFGALGGQCVGLLGRNGAGKTTLLDVCSGALRPSQGRVTRCIDSSGVGVGSGVYYATDKPRFALHHTLRECVKLSANLSGADRPDHLVDSALVRLGLDGQRSKSVATLSSGTLQRVQWAAILVSRPAIVILDEPTAFLDVEGIVILRQLIQGLKMRGAALVLSSHNLHEMVLVCDRLWHLQEASLYEVQSRSVTAIEAYIAQR